MQGRGFAELHSIIKPYMLVTLRQVQCMSVVPVQYFQLLGTHLVALDVSLCSVASIESPLLSNCVARWASAKGTYEL
jgi:hypothetical protein